MNISWVMALKIASAHRMDPDISENVNFSNIVMLGLFQPEILC